MFEKKAKFKRWDRVTLVQATRGKYLRDAAVGKSGVVSEVTESVILYDGWIYIIVLDDGHTVAVKEDYLEKEKEEGNA